MNTVAAIVLASGVALGIGGLHELAMAAHRADFSNSVAASDPAKPGPLTHPAAPGLSPDDSITVPARPALPIPAPSVPAIPAVPKLPVIPDVPALLWPAAEAPYLTGHVQITFPSDFSKAGEAYFEPGPTPNWIIFQAVAKGSDETNYQMYVAKLARNAAGNITGLDPAIKPIRLSPPKSSNTCGWFHPTEPGRVIFGSTTIEPKDDTVPGYNRDKSSYTWKFPSEMRVVSRTVEVIVGDKLPKAEAAKVLADRKDIKEVTPAFAQPNAGSGEGYAAECSLSSDGRFLLYTYRDPKTSNPDIWVLDNQTGKHTPLVTAKGYNGGPFFSPDAKRIVYRSDRKGDSNLQLFITDLAIDPATGAITGARQETQITDDSNVNWTPFWHPSGQYLIFASSKASHRNYEVFSIDATGDATPADRAWTRVTECEGFDGLPVFNTAGDLMMWTSQRGGKLPGEEKPSSQIWIAKVGAKSGNW